MDQRSAILARKVLHKTDRSSHRSSKAKIFASNVLMTCGEEIERVTNLNKCEHDAVEAINEAAAGRFDPAVGFINVEKLYSKEKANPAARNFLSFNHL